MVGHAHRPAGLGLADGPGNLPIGAHLPIGDGLQGLPHLQLEGRPPGRQGQRERPALPGEIRPQLAGGLLQQRGRALLPAGAGPKVQPREGAVFLGECQLPHWGGEHQPVFHGKDSFLPLLCYL